MTLKAFAVSLANTLIARGIEKDKAVSTVLRITRSLSEEDQQEIANYNAPEDFAQLTDALVRLIEDEERAEIIADASAEPVVTDNRTTTKKVSVQHAAPAPEDPAMAQTRKANAIQKQSPVTAADEPTRTDISTAAEAHTDPKSNTGHYTEYKKTELTSRGAKFFWTFFVLLLPLIGLAFLAFFGIFALCVLSVCALIVICFMVLAAAVIAGSIICLVSLIYGIIQMFASLGIGLYEVGLGIVASGLTVLVSVLVYLVGTRVLPYLLKQLLAFTGHTLGQLPGIWDRAREECNKL